MGIGDSECGVRGSGFGIRDGGLGRGVYSNAVRKGPEAEGRDSRGLEGELIHLPSGQGTLQHFS